jgi:inosose dehydratase
MGYGYAMLMYGPEDVPKGLGDLAACRYDGFEIGAPKVQHLGADRVRDAAAANDLDAYCVMSGWLLEDDDAEDAVEAASVAAQVGAEFLGILPPPRGQVDDSTLDGWLADICAAAADAGVVPVVHHHGAAHIEQPHEIEAWLNRAPENLKLLFDTAHYYPYGDVHDGIERFADDIAYVHLKDIDPPADLDYHVERLSAGKVDYDSLFTLLHSFTDLGEGVIDFERVRDQFEAVGYTGNFTAEIDQQLDARLVHAKRNYDYWTGLSE